MKPLDLTEWAQSLLTAEASDVADFGREVLDLIENNCADDWAELVEEIEYACGYRTKGQRDDLPGFDQDKAKRHIEGLADARALLEEIKDKLALAGFLPIRSAPEDGLQLALDKLEAVSGIMDWVRTPEDFAEAFADLRKLFPAIVPDKKPEPPAKPENLEYDL